ncbi:MAG: DUF3093 family protein [Actinomycetota bacterium]|nr:DUF3093 family protein [Actinomycetota bacterium]
MIFDERQRPPAFLWIVTFVVVGAVVVWATLVADMPIAAMLRAVSVPAIIAVVAFSTFQMKTRVSPEGLRVVIVPFPRKTVPASEIAGCEVVTYRPLLEYGGWGWRWSSSRGWAYTMRGNRGVMVHRTNGKSFLVGSQRPEDLAEALRQIAPRQVPPSEA